MIFIISTIIIIILILILILDHHDAHVSRWVAVTALWNALAIFALLTRPATVL